MSILSSVKKVWSDIEKCELMQRKITLIGVTKTADIQMMRELFQCGVSHFGENRIQHAIPKIEALEDIDVTWHMIGHLQRNKAAQAVRYFDWIQSLDSVRLLDKVMTEAETQNRVIQGLIQVNIADDPKKFGFSVDECHKWLLQANHRSSKLRIRGIMCMLPLSDDRERLVSYFSRARELFELVKSEREGIDTLSMGMSNDFQEAINQGSTMVRIGRFLFI